MLSDGAESAAVSPTESIPFPELETLLREIRLMRDSVGDSLGKYRLSGTRGFARRWENVESSDAAFSIASTATCMSALRSMSFWKKEEDDSLAKEFLAGNWRVCIEGKHG